MNHTPPPFPSPFSTYPLNHVDVIFLSPLFLRSGQLLIFVAVPLLPLQTPEAFSPRRAAVVCRSHILVFLRPVPGLLGFFCSSSRPDFPIKDKSLPEPSRVRPAEPDEFSPFSNTGYYILRTAESRFTPICLFLGRLNISPLSRSFPFLSYCRGNAPEAYLRLHANSRPPPFPPFCFF